MKLTNICSSVILGSSVSVVTSTLIPLAPLRNHAPLQKPLKTNKIICQNICGFLEERVSTRDILTLNSSTNSGNPSSSTTQVFLSPTPPLPYPTVLPPFDPTNPETLIAITKAFIDTDFGIQTTNVTPESLAKVNSDNNGDTPNRGGVSQPFYGYSLLSPDFIWVSANNLNDGRTGILNREEYLAAGRFFNVKSSFPDLQYRAHDFRVIKDEFREYNEDNREDDTNDGCHELTVRFTTLAIGTFRGGTPLRLRYSTIEPNGKVMKCPPTSVSVTYSATGTNAGKIIKLVTDMVMDRQWGNTNGCSGITAAAVCAGIGPTDWDICPPLVAVGRFFGRPIKSIQERSVEDGYSSPFPESVMIQLAKGVTASNFGLEDSDLLSESFSYLEPDKGPMNKQTYIRLFSQYNIQDAIPDLDYKFQNYRVDPYNPYRVWVDTRARGTRIGPIGNSPIAKNAIYRAPPESMSFTFDNDGFCTHMTAAAPLDPLLGNTGLLGGVNGILYATSTPESPLKTRSLTMMLNRAQKAVVQPITKAGVDQYRLPNGRIVSGYASVEKGMALSFASPPAFPLPSPPKLPPPDVIVKDNSASKAPFFTEIKSTLPALSLSKRTPIIQRPERVTQPSASSAAPESITSQLNTDEYPDNLATNKPSSSFRTSNVKTSANTRDSSPIGNRADKRDISLTEKSTIQQLREAAQQARAEALEAKQKAAAQKRNTIPNETTIIRSLGAGGLFPFFPSTPSTAKSLQTPIGSAIDSKKSGNIPSALSPTDQTLTSQVFKSFPKSLPKVQKGTSSTVPSPFLSISKQSSTISLPEPQLSKKLESSKTSKPTTRNNTAGSLAKKTPSVKIAGVGGGETLVKKQGRKVSPPSRNSITLPFVGKSSSSMQNDSSIGKQSSAIKSTSTVSQETKVSLSGMSLFGGIFQSRDGKNGSMSKDTKRIIKKVSSPKVRDDAQKVKNNSIMPPKANTPILKQWKLNPDNSIKGRIYGSLSFRDGEMITTSPIRKRDKESKVTKGDVVQTKSGSKYFLS